MINKKEKAMLEADVLNEMFDKFARFADEATDGASSIQIRKLEKDEEVTLQDLRLVVKKSNFIGQSEAYTNVLGLINQKIRARLEIIKGGSLGFLFLFLGGEQH